MTDFSFKMFFGSNFFQFDPIYDFRDSNSAFALDKIIFEPTSDFLGEEGFSSQNIIIGSRNLFFEPYYFIFEPEVDFSSRNSLMG